VDDLRAAWVIMKAVFQSKLEHPAPLLLNTFVNSLDVVTPTLAIAALTHTFGTLGGWSLGEVLLLIGTANACLGISLLLMGAFDSFLFMGIFRSGQFESALLRPGNTVMFLAASNMRPYRMGRVIASFGVLAFGLISIGPERWEVVPVLPVAIVVGSAILSALWFLDTAATVRLGQPNDMTRNTPFIATDMSFFPQSLYPPAGQFLSQLVLGVGAAIYLPIAYALGKDPILGVWSLVAGPAILPVTFLIARTVWAHAISSFVGRRVHSTARGVAPSETSVP